jgi:hypothetical protein
MAAGTAAFFQGRFRDSLALLAEAEQVLRERCTGVAWELDGTHLWGRLALIFTGDLRELARRAALQHADALARSDRFAGPWIEASAFPQQHLAADDPRAARDAIQGAVEAWRTEEGTPAEGASFLAIHFLALWHEALVDLYEGDSAGALVRLTAAWPRVERSLLLRMQICRVQLTWLRGVAALSAARGDPESPHVTAADRDARAVLGEGLPYAEGMGSLLRAGVAATRGRRAETISLLRRALLCFQTADTALFAAIAGLRLAELDPDPVVAERLHRLGRTALAAQGIARPEVWCAMQAPGFAAG